MATSADSLDKPLSKQRSGECAEDRERPSLPGHLVGLPGGQWSLWRWVCVRGAGFPATTPLELSSPSCADAADYSRRAEEEAQNALKNALAAIDRAVERDGAETLISSRKARRQLKRGKLPSEFVLGGPVIPELAAARARVNSARAAFDESFNSATARASVYMERVARDERFREAVTWQNRHALRTGVDALLREGAGNSRRGTKQKQHEMMVAGYLQRYCLKNDTIGFFGPVGWGRIVNNGSALVARPGRELVKQRRVYFETWCIDALAETLARDKSLRPWFCPRRLPFFDIHGRTLYQPSGQASTISGKEAVILQACNGYKPARELAVELIASPSNGLESEAEVFFLLDSLREMGLISWTLEVPISIESDTLLRRLLERIDDDRLCRKALAPLDELTAARNRIEGSAGNAEDLDKSIADFEATFTRVTGVASTRLAGKTYAGRTLVYEDCRRNLELEIGSEILSSLGSPLSLLLRSARWYTFHLAEKFREVFKEIYFKLARKTGSRILPAAGLFMTAKPILFGDSDRFIDSLVPALQQRWENIFSIDETQRRVHFKSDDLRSRVEAAFNAPRPGWKYARYHSPDLLIGGASLDAIRQGDYQLILGELHIASNTCSGALFLAQHPRPNDLFNAIDIDLPEPRLVPLVAKDTPNGSGRTITALMGAKDILLSISPNAFAVEGSQALPIGALVVESVGDDLMIRTRDGRLSFEIIEAISGFMSSIAPSTFKLFGARRHIPRISIDRLIVWRESWSMAASEISFAFEKDDADRFRKARHWAQTHKMPRFIFVKVADEIKPFYADFSSPIYVDIFAKAVRRVSGNNEVNQSVVVSEMLPRPDRAWLPDAEGHLYTSELRMVAVDPIT